jgi:mono/diheme cytochrome c family protein
MAMRWRPGPKRAAVLLAAVLVATALIRTGAEAARQAGAKDDGRQAAVKVGLDPSVSPVAGPSWLNRLGVRYDETTLGRSAATYGPGSDQPPAGSSSIPLQVGRPVTLTGADLYRLNCQSCHRAEGTGSLPEIKSVFAAVQGASLEVVRRQLQEQGKSASAAAARAQADRARSDLVNRIKKGGQRMPAFAHLQDADISALMSYLTQLTGASAAAAAPGRTVSWGRLGENVVKGTCHICHDAVGSRPTSQALAGGTIPPFDVLIKEKPVVDFLTKVRRGSVLTMADRSIHYRGRMPVFNYLRDLEVAAAYMFLVDYPPQPDAPRH